MTFRLEIFKVGKFPTSWSLTKTYGPISLHLRKKIELLSLTFFFSLLSRTVSISSFIFFLLTFNFFFLSFSFLFIFLFLIWIHGLHCVMCPSLIHVRFYPETIYFFPVQFILNELSSSHFLTYGIFVKISFLESLTTYHPENHKNIPTLSEFDKTFLGQWISQDESNDVVRFVI